MADWLVTYNNHYAFVEQLLRDKHPEDIVQEGTAEKNCTDLLQVICGFIIFQKLLETIP